MSMKVLVADDDQSLRRLIVHGLKKLDVVNVVEAGDGDEALARFQQGGFDLVVVDWEMPGRTGPDVAQAIRQSGSQVPILMVTVRAAREHVIQAIEAGATDYLAKPFDQEALGAKLRRFCRPADATIYRARNVMNTDVITIPESATVGQAIERLVDRGISGLPVVDDDNLMVGVITEYELLGMIYRPEIKETPIRELMTTDVLTVGEDALLSQVVHLMQERRIRRIPVVRDGRIVGVISRRDLLRYMTEHEEALTEFINAVRAAQAARAEGELVAL